MYPALGLGIVTGTRRNLTSSTMNFVDNINFVDGTKFFRTKFKDEIISSLFYDKNQRRWKYHPILWDEIKDDGTTSQNFWDDAQPYL